MNPTTPSLVGQTESEIPIDVDLKQASRKYYGNRISEATSVILTFTNVDVYQ